MSKRKLLLADDSETVQKVVNLTFELEGIEVITFGDGDSAMQQLSAVAPDVVLADVNMPGISGYEICQKIKENEATRSTPVILLVGSFEPFDEEKAMRVGADDYLTKPFQSIRQLVSKVNELLTPDVSTFDETLRMESSPYPETEFVDPGMDDEMIETSRVESASFDETARFQSPAGFPAADVEDSETPAEPAPERTDFQPSGQTAEDREAQTVYELNEEPTVEPEAEDAEIYPTFDPEVDESENVVYGKEEIDSPADQFADAPAEEVEEFGIQPDDIDHYYREPDYEEQPVEEYTEEFKGEYGETPVETDEAIAAPVEPAAETPPNVEDERPETMFEPAVEEGGENFYEQTEIAAAEKISEAEQVYEPEEADRAGEYAPPDERFEAAAPPVPVLDFDELDLLEVPYPEALTPVSPENPPPVPEQAETSFAAPAPDIEEESGGELREEVSRQLPGVSLSPEDIEAIADRVVEKLTARLKE